VRTLVHSLLALVSLLIFTASTCDNQDFSERFVLELGPDATSQTAGYQQPYIGRITLDFGLLNTGDTATTYSLVAQAQTTGATEADACESIVGNQRLIRASEAAEDAPVLRVSERGYAVQLDENGTGYVDIRIPSASTYRVYSDVPDAMLTLTVDGTEIEPELRVATLEECLEILRVDQWALNDGTATLLIDAGAEVRLITLYLEEECGALRTVPRTCAGAAADPTTLDEITLSPGGFVSGRMNSASLGVGDQAVVNISCEPVETCAGELEMFFLIEQLECRTDSDCRQEDACSSDAYCLSSGGSGCAASGSGGGFGALGGLVVFSLLVWRRLARRPRAHAPTPGAGLRFPRAPVRIAGPAALAFAGCLLVPSMALASPPRPQVYTDVRLSTMRFGGDVGRFASSGVGVHARQGIQAGWLGAYLSLGTDYYLTNQPPPPYTRGLQTFTVSAGARVALPIERFRPFIGIEYTSLGVASNALNRFTGGSLQFNGIGANVALRMESLLPLYVELQGESRVFIDMNSPTVHWGFSISFGLAGFL
jgi:uncharacterized protein (TIGR03382 family)